MRNAVLGSALVHLLFTIALVAFRMSVKVIVPGPEVVQVALLEPSQPAPVATAAPAPEPPREEPGIRIEKPKAHKPPPKKPEATPEPTPEPARPTPPPAPVQPAARATPMLSRAQVGPAGLKADVGVDESNFEQLWWVQAVREKIAQNWTPPAGLSTGGRPVRTVVYFRVARDGSISSVRIETASGVEYFDRSAVRAVVITERLLPIPAGFGGSSLGIHLGFEWEAP
jgi:TonB family protein